MSLCGAFWDRSLIQMERGPLLNFSQSVVWICSWLTLRLYTASLITIIRAILSMWEPKAIGACKVAWGVRNSNSA
eukprot:14775124-Alexandrium_andersonii.AAC.1